MGDRLIELLMLDKVVDLSDVGAQTDLSHSWACAQSMPHLGGLRKHFLTYRARAGIGYLLWTVADPGVVQEWCPVRKVRARPCCGYSPWRARAARRTGVMSTGVGRCGPSASSGGAIPNIAALEAITPSRTAAGS